MAAGAGGNGGVNAAPRAARARCPDPQAGQWFAVVSPGAGGYGAPAERDRAAVTRDIEEGVIDLPTAREIYGY